MGWDAKQNLSIFVTSLTRKFSKVKVLSCFDQTFSLFSGKDIGTDNANKRWTLSEQFKN